MTLGEVITVTERCEKVLKEYGASPGLRKFCLEIVEYEREISGATLRMHEKLRKLDDEGTQCMDALTPLIESMVDDFLMWHRTVESLAKRGNSLPPLLASKLHGSKLQAASSFRTNTLQIKEGEFLTVTDTSKPNIVKVRTQNGREDYLPILTFILQGSDETIPRLLQRLLVQLLSLWTDYLTRTGKILLRSALDVFHSLNLSRREFEEVATNGASIISRTRKFCDVLERTQKDLSERKGGKVNVQNQELVRNSLKTFTSYQEFFDYWNNFRKKLKERKPQPICIFEKLNDFRNHASDNGRMKCFTTTFVVESTEVREETVHVPLGEYDDDASSVGAGGSWKQSIETEQLTSISQEEKKRYVIRAVRDPRRGGAERISLRHAVEVGIMDMEHGSYTNPDTRESIPIAVALSEGDIQVDYVTKTSSAPKTEALGLITIRDRVDSKGYAIQGAIDALTAEKVDLAEARRRGLIDEGATHFTVSTTGERIDMQDAIESGWVLVESDDPDEIGGSGGGGDPEFRTRTYVVRAVVDQRLKKRVPFLEAVNRRLIDRESGNYNNNLTGETIHVLEAIRRGFLKAKIVDDPSTLDIDPNNKMVVQSISKMKRLVTGLSALSAMKESANRLSTSSNASA